MEKTTAHNPMDITIQEARETIKKENEKEISNLAGCERTQKCRRKRFS